MADFVIFSTMSSNCAQTKEEAIAALQAGARQLGQVTRDSRYALLPVKINATTAMAGVDGRGESSKRFVANWRQKQSGRRNLVAGFR